MNEYKMKRLKYLNEILFGFESKKYYAWFKKKYKCSMWGMNAHHLLRRECDYLLYPFLHVYHLNYVEKNKAKIFCEKVELSVLILQEYLIENYGGAFDLKDFEPEELNKLFDYVKGREK